MIKRVLVYARCSTSRDQKPEVQIEELRRYCQAREWRIAEEIVDHGYSGSRANRPGLKNLMTLVRQRRVDVVVVVKLDRLFRSLKHLVITLQEFQELGIEFISIKDQIDMTTSSGRLLINLLGCFAEFERDLIIDRTRLGLAHARSKGKRLGRPPEHDAKQILSLRDQGLSFGQIQKQLGCPKSSIYRALEEGRKTQPNNDKKSVLETPVKTTEKALRISADLGLTNLGERRTTEAETIGSHERK